MQSTLLANTWVAAHLPGTVYMALLCCSGSAGEAAVSNSLDEQFAEAGYQHLSIAPKHRRPPTYIVIGTALDETSVVRATHRICRDGGIISDPPFFQHAQTFSNATTMNLKLDAVTLDMSCMKAVKKVVSGFLFGSNSLTSIVLPPNLEALWEFAFYNCSKLSTINLQSCPLLRTIGDRAFGCCASLTEIDMSPLLGVKKLPPYLLTNCINLTSVKFPPNIESASGYVLSCCTSVTDIDMSSLVGVKKLGGRFMIQCTSLTTVKLPPNLEELGHSWFGGCPNINAIDTSNLVNVTTPYLHWPKKPKYNSG